VVRQGTPPGVILLDLDHFNNFNNTFGHETGDVLLQELRALLQQHIRGSEAACRYGGEEFTLILVDTGKEVGRRRAEELR
jgi:diguanylate cyclase (GGDEF)-like protein